MRILLVNDDGFDAPGIHALYREMKKLGDIYVSAPALPQSGASHRTAVRGKIKVQTKKFEDDVTGWKVWGSPFDCADLGIRALMDEKPDLVVSGINRGSNVAYDILHSGTVGASSAGLWSGMPTIAVSLNSQGDEYDFRFSARFALRAAKWFVNQPSNRNYVLNINVPNCPESEIRGCVITRMGHRHNYTSSFKKTSEGWFDYYEAAVTRDHQDEDEYLIHDDYAVNHNYISLTPIDMEVTAYESMADVGLLADEFSREFFK